VAIDARFVPDERRPFDLRRRHDGAIQRRAGDEQQHDEPRRSNQRPGNSARFAALQSMMRRRFPGAEHRDVVSERLDQGKYGFALLASGLR
jgi:hypothetical protein